MQGLALIAPHFIVEDISVKSIAEIKTTYETTDLRAKLARWHKDVDNAFYGWNGAWLDPQFRKWNITEFLAYIRVPVLIVQGADDQYGTVKQIEAAWMGSLPTATAKAFAESVAAARAPRRPGMGTGRPATGDRDDRGGPRSER